MMKEQQRLNNETVEEEQGAQGFGHVEGVSQDGCGTCNKEAGNLKPVGVDTLTTTAVVKRHVKNLLSLFQPQEYEEEDEWILDMKNFQPDEANDNDVVNVIEFGKFMERERVRNQNKDIMAPGTWTFVNQSGFIDLFFAPDVMTAETTQRLKRAGMEMEDFLHLINAMRSVESYSAIFSILKLYLNKLDGVNGLSVVEWIDSLFGLCTADEETVEKVRSYPTRAHEILAEFHDTHSTAVGGFKWVNQQGEPDIGVTNDARERVVSRREEFVQGLVSVLRAPKQLKGHPLTRMIQMFMRGLVTIGLCPKLEGEFKVRDFMMFTVDKFDEDAVDVLANLGTAIDDFGHWLVEVFAQGTVNPETGNTDDIAGYDRKVSQLKSLLPYFKAGRLEEVGKSNHDFFLQIHALTALGERMLKKHKCPHTTRLLLSRLSELDNLKTAAHIITLSTKQKVQAFGVLLYGESSVGKSGTNKMLTDVFFQYKIDKGWVPSGDLQEYSITMNVADKYQSEYLAHHKAVGLDDFMNGKPEKTQDNPLDFLTRLINNTPATALKADVGDKGNVPLMAEFVCATTNVKHLHAASFSSEPISILRRVGFTITQTVRPQFRIPGTMMLDEYNTGGETDLWTFDVEMPIKTSTGVGYRLLKFTDDDGVKKEAKGIRIDQLLVMFRQYLEVYFPNQERVLAKANAKVDMCEHRIPKSVCKKCKPKKSEEVDDAPISAEFFDESESETETESDDAVVCENIVRSDSEKATLRELMRQCSWLSDASEPTTEPEFIQTVCKCGDPLELGHEMCDLCDAELRSYCSDDYTNQAGVMDSVRNVVDLDALVELSSVVQALRFVDMLPSPLFVWYARTMMFLESPITRFVFKYRHIMWRFAGAFMLAAPLWPFLAMVSMIFVGLICVSTQVSMERRVREALRTSRVRVQDLRMAVTKPRILQVALAIIAAGVAYKSVMKVTNLVWSGDKRDNIVEEEITSEVVPPPVPVGNQSCPTMSEQGVTPSTPFNQKLEFQEVPAGDKNKTMTEDQMKHVIEKNMMTLIFEDENGNGKTYCSGLAVTSGFMLTVNHAFPDTEEGDIYFVRILIGDGTKSGNTIRTTISCKCIYRFEGHDLALVNLPCIGDRKDIIDLFPLIKPPSDVMVSSIRRNVKGGIVHMRDYVRTRSHKYRTPTNKHVVDGFMYELPFQTFMGLCGMVMVGHGKSPCIHSIHTAGVTGQCEGASDCLLQSDLRAAVDSYLERKHVLKLAQPGKLDLEQMKIGIQKKIHTNSPLHDIKDDSAVMLYGQTTIPVTKFRHSVHKTKCYDDVEELFGMGQIAKPPPAIPGHRHYAKALVNLTNPNRGFPEVWMEEAVNDFLGGEVAAVVVRYKGRLQPLTIEQALNGVLGMRGIDRLDGNTSAGIPYLKSKNQVCPRVGDKMTMDNDMMQIYIFKENLWADGIRTYEVLNLCLKDEAMAMLKEFARSFQCANIHLTVGIRRHYSPLVNMIIDNALPFECALGINCQGPDWHHTIEHLARFGKDRIVAGDHKAYDQHMSSGATTAAFSMLIEMAKDCGYDQRSLAVMRTLATEITHPMINVNGDLAKLFGSNPSGHALTTVVNSLVNSLYHRCVYISLKTSPLPFRQTVSLLTYGDDCAYSAHPDINFGHTDVQRAFADFGLVYTMAKKDAESVQYITLDELSFLKRTPRWDEDLQMYMAPLEKRSIIKPLQWLTKSTLTPEQSMATNIDNAALEFFFHGRGVYDEEILKLREIRSRYSLCQMCIFVDYTYDDMMKRWKRVYSDQKREEHPELFVCKVENSEGSIDYGMYSTKQDVEMRDACSPMATLPDEVPLFRGALGQQDPLDITMHQCNARGEQIRTTDYITREAEKASAEEIRDLDPQSGVVTQSSDMDAEGRVDAHVVTFKDTPLQQQNVMESTIDSTRNKTNNADDGLADFLCRPVLIKEFSVAIDDDVNEDFNPWDRFLTNPRVINRINNYTNLRGKLHVKFMINGNGFYFGKLIASYLPLGPLNDLERPHSQGDLGDILLATQRLHVFIDPCNSAAGEMVLPFFWFRDSLSIVAADWRVMGTMYLESINPLRNANGSTTNLSISVYAWMSEVEMNCPTLQDSPDLVNQMGGMDEYNSLGILSRPMTAAAGLAKAIGNTPFAIAPFATAASSVLSGGAALAKLMGYSRPPDLKPAAKMQPRPVANLANYDTMDTTTKLSLDTKQELTCDPRVMGSGEHDEMTIDSLVSRQNFIQTFQWSPSNAPKTLLQQIKVFPYHTVPKASDSSVCYPSYGIPALEFVHWQGTMMLRLQVACSNFHKGRLLVVYDPQLAATTSETNIQYTYVMDIADQKELTVEIPWSQPEAFGSKPDAFGDPSSAGRGVAATGLTKDRTDNGVVSVFVLNELTTPSSTTDSVFINTYVSFKTGMKFYRPEGSYRLMSFAATAPLLENQMGDMPTDCAEDCQDPTGDAPDFKTGQESDPGEEMLVYGGENIRTMRAFTKRPAVIYAVPLMNGTGDFYRNTFTSPTLPRPRGYYADHNNNNYNYAINSFLTVGVHAFAGYRGAIRWKFVSADSDGFMQIVTDRRTTYGLSYGTVSPSLTFPAPASDIRAAQIAAQSNTVTSNRAREIQHSHTVQCLEGELPYYYPIRFTPHNNFDFETTDDTNNRSIVFDLFRRPSSRFVQVYVSVGEDFTVGQFTGLPPVVGVNPPS